MRLRIFIAVFLTLFAATEARSVEKKWLGTTGQRVKAELFRSADAGSSPVLVIVLHGDLDADSHYVLASNAANHIHGIVAAALVRPGYTDGDGDTSNGKKGNTSGDNYTPEVLNQLDAAIHQLTSELHPSAVVLVGHSGGATISADLIAQDNRLANAALLLSCPCDLPPWRKHMKTLHPSPTWDEPVTSVSPIDVVDKISLKTRVWLAVGDKDDTTPPELTERYAAALQKHGIKPNVNVLPGRNHVIIFDDAVIQELSKLIAEPRLS